MYTYVHIYIYTFIFSIYIYIYLYSYLFIYGCLDIVTVYTIMYFPCYFGRERSGVNPILSKPT